MKRGIFFFGLGLLALAFVAGGAEIAAQAISGELHVWMSLAEVWQVLSPDTLASTRVNAADTYGPLWTVVEQLIRLPGWLLFGGPGFAMAMVCRDRDFGPNNEHEQSLYLYDELSKRAKEEGMDDPIHGDDIMPTSHVSTEPADPAFAEENIEEEDGDAQTNQAPADDHPAHPENEKPS